MFYTLKNGLEEIKVENIKDDILTFGVVKKEEIKVINEQYFHFAPVTIYELTKSDGLHSVNKMDSYFGYCFGIFHVLLGTKGETRLPIGMYIKKNMVCIVCEDDDYEKRFYDVVDKMNPNSYCLERLLTTLIDCIVFPTHAILELLETKINALDEAIMANKTERFNHNIAGFRKEILLLSHYFDQLLDICEELLEDENSFFNAEKLHHLRIFTDRIHRLSEHVLLLREYSVQVREEYQSQVDLSLNQIMYVFTIVTVIFLPLTLIVGWYGMNFKYMPELSWQYGYAFAFLLAGGSILFCLWYFRKKRLFKK